MVKSVKAVKPTKSQSKTQKLKPRRALSKKEIESFNRDGYVFVNLFTKAEMKTLLQTTQNDPMIQGKSMAKENNDGSKTKLTLWKYFGKDTYSAFGRSQSIVGVARDIFGGAEPYHLHTKVTSKEPKVGGAWNWHQDFGYWYNQGLLQPDHCFSAVVAVGDHTRANGCLQVLKGTHKLGRLEHGVFDQQMCVDPSKLASVQKVVGSDKKKVFPLVHCSMKAGTVLFTHSNLLHTSASNKSNKWRHSMIFAYSSKQNAPIVKNGIHPDYNPIDVLPDKNLANYGQVMHDANKSDFLEIKAAVKSIEKKKKDSNKQK